MEQIIICPNCGNILVHQEGCLTCPSCGWSECDYTAEEESAEFNKYPIPFAYFLKLQTEM